MASVSKAIYGQEVYDYSPSVKGLQTLSYRQNKFHGKT